MEIHYELQKGRYLESHDSQVLLQSRNLLNTPLHADIKKRVRAVEMLVMSSFQIYRKLIKAFCVLLFISIIALSVVALYGFTKPERRHRLQVADGKDDWLMWHPFWQCEIKKETLNWTNVDLHCFFGPYKKHNKTQDEEYLSIGNFASNSTSWQPSEGAELGNAQNSLDSLPDIKQLEEHNAIIAMIRGRRRHFRHKPIFLTINGRPFFLAFPPPFCPYIMRMIHCIAIIVSHLIFAIIICHCCRRRHRRRMTKIINEYLSLNRNDNGFFMFADGGMDKLRVVINQGQGNQPAMNQLPPYPALNNETTPLHKDGSEKRQKKMKYILVEEDCPNEYTPLPQKDSIDMKN